ncbi:hypothetical protein VQL36_09520 [Chengkuizengella sp. SCS-71B]|uniref:hypothetical protein n=1 Tax=Chengkuizengella sp. SCS-71B TaxID=3115290 RepID=UPI0032C23B5D
MQKKPSKLLFIMIAVLVVVLLSSCRTSTDTEEPEIKILSDSNEELDKIYYGNLNNEEQEEIEERLKDFMIGKRFIDLPLIDHGDQFLIEALNFESDEFEIFEYVMDERGNIISDYDIKPVNISTKREGRIGIYSFEERHDYEKYQKYAVEGKLIHSLLIRCEIDNASFAFSTLVLSVIE